jgi:hypothetical protein
MKHKTLYQRMQDALYGEDPVEISLRKEALKDALERAKKLVDEGRLGAIIFAEILDAEKNTVQAHPYGMSNVVLETVRMVQRDAAQRSAQQLEKQMQADREAGVEPAVPG